MLWKKNKGTQGVLRKELLSVSSSRIYTPQGKGWFQVYTSLDNYYVASTEKILDI